MFWQTSRSAHTLQGVVLFQTAVSFKNKIYHQARRPNEQRIQAKFFINILAYLKFERNSEQVLSYQIFLNGS